MWHELTDRLWIGGEWIAPAGQRTIPVISPYTEQEITTVPDGSKADIDRAVGAARRAFDEGPWARMPLVERIGVLEALSGELAGVEEQMARTVSAEMGAPISDAYSIHTTRARGILDAMIDLARVYPFESVRESASGRARVLRRPVGVVATIVPWNAPHLNIMQKLAPALLAGCTMVVKPSPETPLDAILLAQALDRAGLPQGVVNIVPAGREVGEYLVTHPGVDKVSFTGSTTAGRRIGSLCGALVRPCTLELGGKSAAILLDDADLAEVLPAVVRGAYRNTGQVCSAKTRILVPAHRETEIVDGLAGLVGDLIVGDPASPATEIGPLVTSAHRERVERMVASGIRDGATPVTGGGRGRVPDRGWFTDPTLFAAVTPRMTIAREEIFGPVATVIAYRDTDDAIAIANDTDYGLSGSIFGADVERAEGIATRIRTGVVEINGNPTGFTAPMGGVKRSGIGREMGPEGFDAFVEITALGLPPR
ncbi:aldehyde dehydrogenase [Tsukamurella sp. NPDC003166]|uniref:aldehyde dehydrogenase n=1 Tax=Tsukamurella sp. NPDC003166 TaxID=3154444 RepID=UPI0033AF0414